MLDLSFFTKPDHLLTGSYTIPSGTLLEPVIARTGNISFSSEEYRYISRSTLLQQKPPVVYTSTKLMIYSNQDIIIPNIEYLQVAKLYYGIWMYVEHKIIPDGYIFDTLNQCAYIGFLVQINNFHGNQSVTEFNSLQIDLDLNSKESFQGHGVLSCVDHTHSFIR